jgi:hypothetical protein
MGRMSGIAELRDSLREANDKIAELENAYEAAMCERNEALSATSESCGRTL